VEENPVIKMSAFVRDVTPEGANFREYESAKDVFLLKLIFNDVIYEYVCLTGNAKINKVNELKKQGFIINDEDETTKVLKFLKQETDA